MRTVLLLCFSLCFTATSFAADKDKEAMRRVQQQNQRLAQEKMKLEGELAALNKKVQELEAQAARVVEAEADAQKARAAMAVQGAKAKKTQEEMAATLAERDARIQELSKAQAELNAKYKNVELTRNGLSDSLDAKKKELASCEDKNAKLYTFGMEMTKRYEEKSALDATLQHADIFTGIKGVEVYNVVQEYRDKLEAQKLEVKVQQ